MVMEWCFFFLVASFTVSTVSEDYSCPAVAPAVAPAARPRRTDVALTAAPATAEAEDWVVCARHGATNVPPPWHTDSPSVRPSSSTTTGL